MWISTLLLALITSAAVIQEDEKYVEVPGDSLVLRYKQSEILAEEADSVLEKFLSVKRTFETRMLVQVPHDLTLTLNSRNGSKRYYSTNGVDEIQVNYPNPSLFRPPLPNDPRVVEFAVPTLVQLWLHALLSDMAGLDPRITLSLVQFVEHMVLDEESQHQHDPDLDIWTKMDDLYGPDTAAFVWNALLGERIPAHRIGEELRRTAADVTEDPQGIDQLFDLICPRRPLFGAVDHEPGPPLAPGTTLRPSRIALFNGSRLRDQPAPDGTENIDAIERLRWFENIFELVTRSFPDRSVNSFPPTLNGVKLWECYFEYKPRAMRARDNIDYYLVLREFLSSFHDRSLTLVTAQGTADIYGVVGLSLEDSKGRVMVSKVTPESAPALAGVKSGMEVVRIDDRPTQLTWSLLTEYLWQFNSLASLHEARARALNMLLTGADGSQARLVLRDGASNPPTEHEFTFERTRPTGGRDIKLVETELRDDGVAVMKIQAFAGNVTQLFHNSIEEIIRKQPRGLIIDLRGNEVGTPQNALTALGRIANKEVTVATVESKENPVGLGGKIVRQPVLTTPLPNLSRYEGPAAVLIDAWTSGPAELFAAGFQSAQRGPVVGQQSAGAVNQPIVPIQPQQNLTAIGVVLQLTHHQVLRGDSSRLQGVGVSPDSPCEPSATDLAQGVDTALLQAIQLLLGG